MRCVGVRGYIHVTVATVHIHGPMSPENDPRGELTVDQGKVSIQPGILFGTDAKVMFCAHTWEMINQSINQSIKQTVDSK